MSLPSFTMRQLLESGVHFGHHPRRWNPKMSQYIFGKRGGIHILDLQQTYPMLQKALEVVYEVASKGGRILFVGTKRQAADIVAQAAQSTGHYYVNHRWLGGMLTNWNTISKSIKRLEEVESVLENNSDGLTKKEQLRLLRSRDKLRADLGGIREMGGVPDAIIVVDAHKEVTAISEANKLGVPVIAVCDSNADPDGIDYIIPGNDDARRAIEMYCNLFSTAILEGMQKRNLKAGKDIGASENIEIVVAAAEKKSVDHVIETTAN